MRRRRPVVQRPVRPRRHAASRAGGGPDLSQLRRAGRRAGARLLQRDDHDRPLTMLPPLATEVQEVQIPLLSALLLGGCATKFTRVVRVGSVDAGLGPTALFPMHLRRPVAMAMCAAELACGVALLVTAGGLGRGQPANTVRLAASAPFLRAT